MLKSDTDSKAQALHTRAGNPKSARYLISTRLVSEYRQYLAKDDPAELLHHWLVLEYPSLEASRAAKESMNRDPSFLQIAQDYYLDFSVTVPNDTYYNFRIYIPGTNTYGTRQKVRYSQDNPARDDYAMFPEDEYGAYYNDGYTVSVGNDWIGYVCPNAGTSSGVCL